VIQRKIIKAQELVFQSVNRVMNAGRSQNPASPDQEKITRWQFNNLDAKSMPLLLFAREVLQNPRGVGAACPSSRRLSEAVAKMVPNHQGLVIELGAGTGIITEALLKNGLPPEQLLAIEKSSQLSAYLQNRFPQLKIIEGDALHLKDFIGDSQDKIAAIICGLPFRSLPERIVHGIIKQVELLLPEDGLFLQYTYDLMGMKEHLPHHFKRVAHKIVWGNLPPARVNVYQIDKT